MARVTVEDCLKNVDSRFSLVHLAVRRVLQLRSGAPLQIANPKNKEVVLALREIASGKVSPDNIRQLEETKVLAPPPPPQEKEEVTRREVKEILEAATQYDVSQEFEELEQLPEQEQEQGQDLE
ncbi:MAG: DNA-directed RNA polymerase subunit omega [Syntrophobacteraceae bacterium]|nr:DNA-directed RNA polymerase subunit omega [Desulfobacteraceae bacterium]